MISLSIFRSFLSVGFFTVICRVTGYLRDRLLASYLGANEMTDALSISMRLPALFRRLFAEGAFHVTFLPAFTRSGRDKHFAGMILTVLLIMLTAVVGVVEWQFPTVIKPLINNMSDKPEMAALVLRWGPIMFPYVFFISLVSFWGSIMNAYGRFAWLALSHAIGNVTVITIMAVGGWTTGEYGEYFAWGVLISGAVQMVAILVPFLRAGYGIRPQWPRWTPEVQKFLWHFLPGIFSVGVAQMNALVGLWFAAGLAKGSVSFLTYGERLYQLPLTIIGISLSSVLLPAIAERMREKNWVQANTLQHQALCFSMFLAMPAAVFLWTMALPLVVLLFGAGKLTPVQYDHIAWAVRGYSIGLPAYILIKMLNTRFFAQHETRLPLVASCVGVLLDVVGVWLLIQPLAHTGIALATSMSAWGTVMVLMGLLAYKDVAKWRPDKNLWLFWAKIMVSVGVSAAVWHGAAGMCQVTWGLWRIFGLISGAGFVGSAVFLCCVWLQGGLKGPHLVLPDTSKSSSPR